MVVMMGTAVVEAWATTIEKVLALTSSECRERTVCGCITTLVMQNDHGTGENSAFMILAKTLTIIKR